MQATMPEAGHLGTTGESKALTRPGLTEADRAADRIHSAIDHVVQGALDAVDKMAAQAAPALDRARDGASNVATTTYTKIDDFINSEDWAESARDGIRAHPLAVVGVALAVGLLIGRL